MSLICDNIKDQDINFELQLRPIFALVRYDHHSKVANFHYYCVRNWKNRGKMAIAHLRALPSSRSLKMSLIVKFTI